MRLLERGSGRPRVAVVGGIHGDEPAGERIVERVLEKLDADADANDADAGANDADAGANDADAGIEGTVQLLVANEPALDAGERYLDTDLNRSFPGDVESDAYETALAPRILAVLEDADAILALHTSQSAPPPFAIYSELTDSVRRTVTGMGVEYVADAGALRSTTLDSTLPHTVSLEAGRQGSEGSIEFGYAAALSFLRAHGVLTDEEPTFSETRVVEGHEEMPKGDGEPTVNYANFEEIPQGAVFACDDVYTHRVARDDAVPILASEHGYDDIFGILGSFAATIEPPNTE